MHIITAENLKRWLGEISKEQSLIAPVRNELGDVLLLPVEDAEEIDFDFEKTLNSPKEFFFPDCETLYTFKSEPNLIKVEKETEEFVIFGVRACDAAAIGLLDKFYSRKFEDDYYLDKRKRSLLIALGCSKLSENCFCTSTKTGPFLKKGFDIQLIPFGDRYAVQTDSDKGRGIVEEFEGRLFEKAKNGEIEAVEGIIRKGMDAEPRFSLEKVSGRLKNGDINEEFWKDIAERCQSCGLCLFICPTCSCYTTRDHLHLVGVSEVKEVERVRQWDGCYFEGFTRLAGGFNPVQEREEMVRRKYEHKLVQQVEEFGMPGCTGCGRCNSCCVGNVDWLENLVRIQEEKSG